MGLGDIIEELARENPAIMFLAYPLNFMPMRDWVKGYYFNPCFCQDLYFYPLSKG